MELNILFDDPELKRRYDAIQAELAEKTKASVEQVARRAEDRWGPTSTTPQRMFAMVPSEELMKAAVAVFTLTTIMERGHMKEADVPAMAKVIFTTFFGYCLKAQIEVEGTPNGI